jgi:hypothetical protein
MTTLPANPSTVGKQGSIKDPAGTKWSFTVDAEIMLPQSGLPTKLLCLQRIKFESGAIHLRLGYYIIGKRPSRAGKWVWGQYATMIPAADLKELTRLAEEKKWFA